MHTAHASLAWHGSICGHDITLGMLAELTSVLLPKASSAHSLYPLCLSQASSVLLHAIAAFRPNSGGCPCHRPERQQEVRLAR